MSLTVENPRGGCVLSGINSVLGAIGRVCPVFHSGPGCCMQTSAAEQGQSGGKSACFVSGVSIPSTNMLEKQVVFGGLDKLRSTVAGAVEIIDADAYFILSGCTSGIIGDDVESVAQEFRDKGEKVYAIDTPGFAGDSNLGYEVVWNNFINQVIEDGLEKKPNLVNVFGIVPYHDPFWAGNLEEILRILNSLGLEVNTFFTGGQSLDNVRKSSAAALNIIINPWLFKGPAEKFKEKFGTPFMRFPFLPVGATDTSAFVRQVGQTLGLDAELVERVIATEEKYVYSYLAQSIGALSWKKFAVVSDASSAVGITRYLANDYSFTPKLTVVSEQLWRKEDIDRVRENISNLEYAAPPKLVVTGDQYKINKALEEDEDLSLIVGSTNERDIAGEKGIQCVAVAFPLKDRLIFNRAICGYRGSLTLTEDLYDNL